MEATQRKPAGGGIDRLSSTRGGNVVIALIAAVIAAVILVFALQRYKQSVESQSKPVTVLVASKFIEQGTSGAAIGVGHYFHSAKYATKQVAHGALANPALLHGEVVARDIYAGEQLTASDFVSGGLFYSKLPPNQRAVSLPLNTARGLVGDVHDGDRVDVYASFSGSGVNTAFVRLVAANVVVLDAGQLQGQGALSSVGQSQESDVVLEVSTREAAELAFASDNGKVWLILSPANGTAPSAEAIDELDFLTGKNGLPIKEGTP